MAVFYVIDMPYGKQPWNGVANLTTILAKPGNFPTRRSDIIFAKRNKHKILPLLLVLIEIFLYFGDRCERTYYSSAVPILASAGDAVRRWQDIKGGYGLRRYKQL